MNDLEKMIMDEISTMDDMRLIDVLGFIRFLKAEKPVKSKWIDEWFKQALKSIHERTEELELTPAQISKQNTALVKKHSSNG